MKVVIIFCYEKISKPCLNFHSINNHVILISILFPCCTFKYIFFSNSRDLNDELIDESNGPNFDEELNENFTDFRELDEDLNLPPDLSRLLDREEKQIEPYKEEVEILDLGSEDLKKEVKIGTTLSLTVRESLISLLKEFIDVFTWSYLDMPGLESSIVEHKIQLMPDCKPVKQKLRRMKPEMLLKVKEEVQKLLDVKFIKVARYPEWVANIVPVPKKGGKVRVCIDYRT